MAQIKAPFDGKRFENLQPFPSKSLWDVIKWRLFRPTKSSQWPDTVEQKIYQDIPPRQHPLSIRVINHATALIQMDGLNILTDPQYSERASPVSWAGPKRVRPPAIPLKDLPPIDVVVISHNHYDHLDLATLKKIEQRDQPLFLVGLGNAPLLEGEGLRLVTTMDWWDTLDFKNLKIHFVPVQHWSARGLFDRKKTLWGGFYIEGSKKVFFSGDTGYGKVFSLINERLGAPDVSLLPIGAYEPRFFMKNAHVNPADAVQAFLDLKSKKAIGIHFATFASLTDEAIDQPLIDLKNALQEKGLPPESFVGPEFGKSYSDF